MFQHTQAEIVLHDDREIICKGTDKVVQACTWAINVGYLHDSDRLSND